jgi:aryl-alcohol dehydrogenase-like predicted oxidoreductase
MAAVLTAALASGALQKKKKKEEEEEKEEEQKKKKKKKRRRRRRHAKTAVFAQDIFTFLTTFTIAVAKAYVKESPNTEIKK